MDNREIDRLYKEHRDGLYRYVLKIVGSRELAEDITEDAFLRSVEKHGDLKETAAFRSWLYTIAYRKCLDCINEQKRTVSLDSDGGSAAAEERARLNEPLKLPEDYAVNEDTKRRLGGLIDQLKPSMRSAVMLYYYDGLSIDEVAKRLGISSNAAAQLLFRARRKLKKQLERLPELGTVTLCAVPPESIIGECAESVSVPAVGSRISVTPLAVKVIGAAAAVGLAVGIPLGLSAARDGRGGLAGDARLTESYAATEHDDVLTDEKPATETTETAAEPLFSNNEGIMTHIETSASSEESFTDSTDTQTDESSSDDSRYDTNSRSESEASTSSYGAESESDVLRNDHNEKIKNYDGFIITPELARVNIYDYSVTFQIENTTGDSFYYSPEWSLQREDNGEWVEVKADDVDYPSVADILGGYETAEVTVTLDICRDNGILPEGEYRLYQDFTMENRTQIPEADPIYAVLRFTVRDEAEAL